jgi:hypothetical protein
MTREEFEAGSARRSGMTVDTLRSYGLIVRPCRCGEPGCDGWQVVTRAFAELLDLVFPEWEGRET